jgi:hypothetical protein
MLLPSATRHAEGPADDDGKQGPGLRTVAAENLPALEALWRVCFRWELWLRQVTGDSTYGTTETIVAVEDAGMRASFPLPDFDHRSAYFGRDRFTYEAERDAYRCLDGQEWRFREHKYTERTRVYQAPAAACNACPLKTQCTTSANGRQLTCSFDEAYLEQVGGYHATEGYKKEMRKRQAWAEPLFAEAKTWHGLGRFRIIGSSFPDEAGLPAFRHRWK